MVGIYCAIKGCWDPYSKSSKHSFPNPEKNLVLFKKWVKICGNERLLEEGMTPQKIYKNCRVCGKHFAKEDYINKQLKRSAFPHVNVPEQSDHSKEKQDSSETGRSATAHDYAVMTPDQPLLHAEPSSSNAHLSATAEPVCTTPPRGTGGLLSQVNVRRSGELSPKAYHLYKTACYLKRKARASDKCKLSLKQRLKEATKFTKSEMFEKVVSSMNSIQSRFFEMQLENCKRKRYGRRYRIEDKVAALAMLKQCGSGYKHLSKVFCLPSAKTLMRLLNRIPIQPGICEGIFNVLKAETKAFKDPLHKYCVLLFDEMSIQPGLYWNLVNGTVEGFEDFGYRRTNKIADHVQVFMLRGIKKGWKQPIYYNFVEGATKSVDIAHIIKLLVSECLKAGLQIVATVCDQGQNNVAAINQLVNDTKAKNFREDREQRNEYFEIDNNKIIPLYDGPHLIKGLRNNLLKYDVQFEIEGETYTAKWKHITKAFSMDPYLGSLRMMPKLTEQHVNPNGRDKMKVSLCTQVLSRTVAATINLMALSGTAIVTAEGLTKMDKEATETAKFLEFADNLFDSINGNSVKTNKMKPLKSAVTENSGHLEFWQLAKRTLSSMKFLKTDGSRFVPPSVKNFIKTLNNFNDLHYLLVGLGFQYTVPRLFNQDPLENFFGKVRQRGRRYTNPTCASFTPFYKSLLVNDYTSSHSMGANCEADSSEIFVTLQRFVTQGLSEEYDEEIQPIHVPYSSVIDRSLKPFEEEALTYVCGHLLRSACKQCKCARQVLQKDGPTNPSDEYTKLKQYKNCKLTYVSNFFRSQMTQALKIINYILQRHVHERHVLTIIYKTLFEKINFTDCDHNDNLKKIIFTKFIRTVGCNYLKQINAVLNGKDRRPVPCNAPSVFKICSEKFKKSCKKYK